MADRNVTVFWRGENPRSSEALAIGNHSMRTRPVLVITGDPVGPCERWWPGKVGTLDIIAPWNFDCGLKFSWSQYWDFDWDEWIRRRNKQIKEPRDV